MHRNWLRIVAAVATVATLAGTGSVLALSWQGADEISQETPGVAGSAEVGDFAASTLVIGDFDADGHGDVVMGLPFENLGAGADAGQVQVFPGSPDGVDARADRTLSAGTPGVPTKAAAGDQFGSALAVGNFDGDGYPDLAIGVPGKDDEFSNVGHVMVVHGGPNGLRAGSAQAIFQGDEGIEGGAQRPRAFFGHALAVGDFDGDTFDDLAVGAPGDRPGGTVAGGSVTILWGSEDGFTALSGGVVLSQESEATGQAIGAEDMFGWALAAGDFDGDQITDLAVGAPGEPAEALSDAGAVTIFGGSADRAAIAAASVLDQATPGVKGPVRPGDRFGAALAAANFDGDGFDDLAIGAPGRARKGVSAAGLVHAVPGSAEGLAPARARSIGQFSKGVATKASGGDLFGAALAAGHFDDNPWADLAVGAPGERIGGLPAAGQAHVLFGKAEGLRPGASQVWSPGVKRLEGAPQALAGVATALAVGDIDGDGLDDLVLGVPGRRVAGRDAAGSFVVVYS